MCKENGGPGGCNSEEPRPEGGLFSRAANARRRLDHHPKTDRPQGRQGCHSLVTGRNLLLLDSGHYPLARGRREGGVAASLLPPLTCAVPLATIWTRIAVQCCPSRSYRVRESTWHCSNLPKQAPGEVERRREGGESRSTLRPGQRDKQTGLPAPATMGGQQRHRPRDCAETAQSGQSGNRVSGWATETDARAITIGLEQGLVRCNGTVCAYKVACGRDTRAYAPPPSKPTHHIHSLVSEFIQSRKKGMFVARALACMEASVGERGVALSGESLSPP